jgi:probable F420-dependent oxidoreductase
VDETDHPAPSPATRDARLRGLTIRVGIAPGAAVADAGALWSLTETLEDSGYDSIWLSDAVTFPGLAPLPTLAAIAARTDRLKLGTSVLALPPRNPVMLARELATVDVLSRGRLLPAGGLGLDAPVERAASGLARGERVARLEEALRVVRLLWTGEEITFEGRFCALQGVRLDPAPLRPRLEVWLAGRAAPALRRVGRIADGWLASLVTADEFAAATDVIRTAAAESGRSIDEDHYGMTLFCAATEDDLAASEYLRAAGRLRPDLPVDATVAVGPEALRRLIASFVAHGASKFVLIPIARDLNGFLRALRTDVIEAVET